MTSGIFSPATHFQNAQTCHEAIGFSLFMKGLISPKLGEIQELDYDFNHMPTNYNKIRWEKKITSSLQTFITSAWNERCKIIHAANINANEIRCRQQAWEFLCDIKRKNGNYSMTALIYWNVTNISFVLQQ